MPTQIIIMAAIVESLVTNIWFLFEKGVLLDARIKRGLALLIGVLVAVLAGIDAFEAVGLPLQVPYAGSALTGILISRGANIVADLFKSVTSLKTILKVRSVQQG